MDMAAPPPAVVVPR
uniref:Uncharacterized protein n=1 Tax=Arundo donax TaxID=35708 RepID=A0A0A9B7Y7_ARUDO